jgi:hypothetical protein
MPAIDGPRFTDSLGEEGLGKDLLIILLGFAIAFFIIGVVIPLMAG